MDTPKDDVTVITDLAQLSEATMIQMPVDMVINGKTLRVKIRALSAKDHIAADTMLTEVRPPKKMNPTTGREEEDRDNSKFREDFAAANHQRDVFIFEKGTSLTIPGGTPAEKDKWMRENLSYGMISTVVDKIIEISSPQVLRN